MRQGLGDKTYGLLQVPSQWTILHASQVLPVSSCKCCCNLYTCICLLRFLWNTLFLLLLYVYLQNGKNNKKEKKKKRKKEIN